MGSETSRHKCLMMIEAHRDKPLYLSQGADHDYNIGPYQCYMTIIGDHSGYYNSGLAAEVGEIGLDEAIFEDKNYFAEKLSDKEIAERKRNSDFQFPIRLIFVWTFELEFITSLDFMGTETDVHMWPDGILDWDSINVISEDKGE